MATFAQNKVFRVVMAVSVMSECEQDRLDLNPGANTSCVLPLRFLLRCRTNEQFKEGLTRATSVKVLSAY